MSEHDERSIYLVRSTWYFEEHSPHTGEALCILTGNPLHRIIQSEVSQKEKHTLSNVCPSLVCVQFSHSVVSDSLRPHGLQHARLLSPSPSLKSLLRLMSIESVMPSSHLVFCHPLFLLPSIFLSIKVFSSELLFASGGQSTRASASASVLPVNIHD